MAPLTRPELINPVVHQFLEQVRHETDGAGNNRLESLNKWSLNDKSPSYIGYFMWAWKPISLLSILN